MRDYYIEYAKLHCFNRALEKAKRIIDKAMDVTTFGISMSFGKDSTAMAHIILSIYPQIPILYVNCGEFDEWPDTDRVKREFCAIVQPELIELHGPSIFDVYNSVGLYVQDEEHNKDSRAAQRNYGNSLGVILDDKLRELGIGGSFIGMRSEESKDRMRLFSVRGPLYFAKTRGLWHCSPIYHFTARDIWAYIYKHNLPYNELYDKAPEGRELARNGAMFGTRSARYGRLVFLKQMYPELFNRFADRFPDVRNYL